MVGVVRAPALDLVFAGTHIQIPFSIIFIHLSFAYVCSCKEGFKGRKCNERKLNQMLVLSLSTEPFLLSLAAVCREGCKYGSCNQPGDCR